MKAIITAIFLFLSIPVFACSCLIKPAFKSTNDLKDYSFIALVKITQTAPFDEKYKFMGIRKDSVAHITVLELFKGKATDVVIDGDYLTDCNMLYSNNEEWLLYAYERNGKTYVSRCSYSTVYRDATGFRDWNGFRGIRDLDLLRRLYQHSPNLNVANNLFFPNGKPEIRQKIVNGKLEGKRYVYYPSGKLYLTEDFKHSIRTGLRRIYDTSGHLISLTRYKNGLKKEVIRYQDTAETAWYLKYQIKNNKDPLFGDHEHDSTYFANLLDSLRSLKHWDREISFHEVFSDDGHSYSYSMFYYDGKPEAKYNLDWQKKLYEGWVYYKGGKLHSYMRYDQAQNIQLEIDYEKDGTKREFKKACELCKFYFDKDKPEATAEPVYIQ
ncbi:hypothetical protein CKK33_10890 [Mucilaginibacter sp. MD40]|nr:hypothetical protein CKK33_10890 [Mucilaginibacter sp. MD40]